MNASNISNAMRAMKHVRVAALLLAGLHLFIYVPVAVAEITKLEAGPSETVRVDTFIPDNPTASILLLPGSFGQIIDYKYFPLSVVKIFNNAGIAVAVMDVPSNKRRLRLIDRISNKHKVHLNKAIAFLKRMSGKPVWVQGTSTGSLSAAFAGTLNDPNVAGIVLMSSLTNIKKTSSYTSKKAKFLMQGLGDIQNVQDLELEKIKVPTLVLHHERDKCGGSSAEGLPKIMAGLKNVPAKLLLTYSGGYSNSFGGSSGDDCDTNSNHLFVGNTQAVTQATIEFIHKNTK